MDLRGLGDRAERVGALAYPDGAVLVVSGLPGSGKSTLLRRWAEFATEVAGAVSVVLLDRATRGRVTVRFGSKPHAAASTSVSGRVRGR